MIRAVTHVTIDYESIERCLYDDRNITETRFHSYCYVHNTVSQPIRFAIISIREAIADMEPLL